MELRTEQLQTNTKFSIKTSDKITSNVSPSLQMHTKVGSEILKFFEVINSCPVANMKSSFFKTESEFYCSKKILSCYLNVLLTIGKFN